MIVKQIIFEMTADAMLGAHGNSLRGYFANRFHQFDILHNHKTDGSCLYLYPRIQYRVINGKGYIIGIEEGVNLLQEIEPQIETIELKGKTYCIIKKKLISEDVRFGVTDSVIKYRFIKPWIALNEKNYSSYKQLRTQKERGDFLRNILIGNLLSIAKSLGYIVGHEIKATTDKLRETEIFLKGTPMLGFLGTFSVNFEIPDYWGIGKSVSRGFGTVVRHRA
jgi:hypothetical protein